MSPDRPPSDRQICALNTIGQFIDINNIMPWLDVWFSDEIYDLDEIYFLDEIYLWDEI